MNPLISIIIPVYNAEKYLRQCFNSVLAQTYPDWECILVDDGSKDSSGDICDEYAQKDSRFKVYHKENGGVSSARNYGLQTANGELICFLDSDDKMKSNHLAICVQSIGEADLLIFGFERWNGRTDCVIPPEAYISGHEYCKEFLYKLKETGATSELFCFPWNKIYKRSLLLGNNVSFPENISLREDEIFAYRCIPFVNNIKVISEALVEYNDEPSGLSAKKNHPQKSLALAGHLIAQTTCDNTNRSKTILFFRAMVYMIDAIINTTSFPEKKAIAKKMMMAYQTKEFEFEKAEITGKQRKTICAALDSKSLNKILLLALMTEVLTWYRIHIRKDKNLLRWGTNV